MVEIEILKGKVSKVNGKIDVWNERNRLRKKKSTTPTASAAVVAEKKPRRNFTIYDHFYFIAVSLTLVSSYVVDVGIFFIFFFQNIEYLRIWIDHTKFKVSEGAHVRSLTPIEPTKHWRYIQWQFLEWSNQY